jgi:uncharacterized protein
MLIDIHLHVIRVAGLPRANGDNYPLPEQVIEFLDRKGIDKGVLLPGIIPEARKQYSTNEDILEIAGRYPDRLIPFCSIDPRAEGNSPEADLSRQILWYKEKGCKGVGELTANMEIGDPLVQNLFKHCAACGMPVLIHMATRKGGGYGLIDRKGLPGLEATLKRFPGLTLIGHSQPFWAELGGDLPEEERNGYPKGPVAPGGALPRLLEECPNLYCDLSANSGYGALTRDPDFTPGFLERFADRLLHGTDFATFLQDFKQPETLRELRDSGRISEEVFAKIAWRNADRLLGLGLA